MTSRAPTPSSSTSHDSAIERALDDVRAARRSVGKRIDDDTPEVLRRRAQVMIDDLDAIECDLLLAVAGNRAARAGTVADVRRSLGEVDVMSHRWFAQLRGSAAEVEVGLTNHSIVDTQLDKHETESDLALDRAIEALRTEPDLARARHIAARAIERVRDRIRVATITLRERAG